MNFLYRILPVIIQNILITIKNFWVYYYKYGAIPLLKPIGRVQQDVIKNVKIHHPQNLQKIDKLLRNCTKYVEYFSRRKSIYVCPIQSIEDFYEFPSISKLQFKQNIGSFYSSKVSKTNSIKFRTSGTTGSPMVGFVRIGDMQLRFQAILKAMCESGFDISDRYARFVGKGVAEKGNVYRTDLLNRHYFFSISRISDETALLYYKAIKENRIKYLEGYPSTISNLVDVFRRNNLFIAGVKLVMLTAEKLNDHDRQNIQEYFKCKIFDYYGSTEQSIFIYRPSDKEYYEVSNSTGYLEVRKEDGTLASDGEEGELLVTSYTSSYTPLVRYQIGDRCVVHRRIVLEDGSWHYMLKEIIGRNEESFRTRDGRIVSRFSLVLKFLPDSVLRAQLFLSEKSNEIKVVYVADVEIKSYEFDRFVSKISEMVGLGYVFSFDRVKDLTRGSSGKIRTVFVEKDDI